MKLVCRPSKLSLAQADIVCQKIGHFFSEYIEIITKSTLGDNNQDVPIYALGEKDVFTKDIDTWLLSGVADFAVHSMKDVGVEQYTGNEFVTAVVEREIPHDVVIFKKNIEKRIRKLIADKQPLCIGTSSLRREELAPPFLKKALPNGDKLDIKIVPIRGNIDTRLKKLDEGDVYDAIIIAAAGLNRLLNRQTPEVTNYQPVSAKNKIHATIGISQEPTTIHELQPATAHKKMFLPLIECTPAPAQGVILAVALRSNAKMAAVLEKINDAALAEKINAERALLKKYGGGCHQRFGVCAVEYRDGFFLNVAGKNAAGENISATHFDLEKFFPENNFEKKFQEKKIQEKNNFFCAADFMKFFFEKKYFSEKILREKDIFNTLLSKKNIFVAHHHAVGDNKKIIAALKGKKIWTAGTRTWFELAKRGVWVEGCADGFGFDWLQTYFEKKVIGIAQKDILVLTNDNAARDSPTEHTTVGTYTLHPTNDALVIAELQKAEIIFWTSFMQFQFYKDFVRADAQHCCPSGKTAEKLRALDLNPIVFPSIKVFLDWRTHLKPFSTQ